MVELQAALYGMMHYCRLWKLDINTNKTKVVVYGSKHGSTEDNFKFGDHIIHVVSEYTYLGICFPCNNNFNKGISILKNQASRAMFSLIKKSRRLGLDFDVQLQLFDGLILPIMLYGCEVWGFKKVEILEKLQLQYCTILLNMKKCTPNVMVLGELGRLPIECYVNCRMLGFWHKLVTGNQNKISCILYKLMFNMHVGNIYSSEWIMKIKKILIDCNMSEYWVDHNRVRDTSYSRFKHTYKDKLTKMFNLKWTNDMQVSSKCSLYRNFKTELVMEKYLLVLPKPLKYALIRFRTSNHRLPIEVGRYHNIERKDRVCTLCSSNDIGDEYHHLVICPYFYANRLQFIPKYVYEKPSVFKFCEFMSFKKKKVMVMIAQFCKIINNKFSEVGL